MRNVGSQTLQRPFEKGGSGGRQLRSTIGRWTPADAQAGPDRRRRVGRRRRHGGGSRPRDNGGRRRPFLSAGVDRAAVERPAESADQLRLSAQGAGKRPARPRPRSAGGGGAEAA